MNLTPRQRRIVRKLQRELLEMDEQGAIELDMWPTANLFIRLIDTDEVSPKTPGYWATLGELGKDVME